LKRKNSYDFLRLFAAGMVVFSHSFALSGNKEPMVGSVTLGTVGVWVFFILSGYLIAISWDQYPRFNVFFAKRALRIFPGLIVNLLLTIIVLGLFYSTYNFIGFLGKPGSLEYINNIFLYTREYVLPGVFTKNILPNGVNGSLWTLAYEFTMYIAIALIGVSKLYKKISAIQIWLGLFAMEVLIVIFKIDFQHRAIFFLKPERIILLALLFFSGVVMYKAANKIKLDYKIGLLSFVLFIIASILMPQSTPILAPILLAYALFSFGRSDKMSFVSRIGDLSYGIYIYSFTIQQMLVASTQTRSPWKLFLASFFLSVIVAFASWHLIESRALKLKKKINIKKYPLEHQSEQVDSAW